MQINPVAPKLISPYHKNNHTKNNHIPSFTSAELGVLKEKEIESLYYDSAELSNIVKQTMPVLKEKFSGMFNAVLSIFPDVERTISLDIKPDIFEEEKIRKYIVENNDKFNFPDEMLEDYKTDANAYSRWLHESEYNPFLFTLEEKGEKEIIKLILDFCKDINDDKLIAELYKSYDHSYTPGKKIPSYYWEFPGG